METPNLLPDSPMRGVDFLIQISPRIRSQNRNGLKASVRDLGQSDLCKNIGKTCSLPCPFQDWVQCQVESVHSVEYVALFVLPVYL